MPQTASDVLVDTLAKWGVGVVFGIPGDGVNGVIEALRKRQDDIRFIQVRHEEAAAFMATAYAKFTGKLGCCLSTSGPGGIHLLNGLYDAKMDGAPVIAITGLQFHDLVGSFTQQDVALDKLFEDVACFNERIMGPAHVEGMTELACRTALARRQPAHLTICVDHQSEALKKDKPSERNLPHHISNVMASGVTTPVAGQLQKAADILNTGQKVTILAGQGALGCEAELAKVSDLLAAPVAKALLGKAALPDDHPHCTGGVGLLGTAPSQDALEGCDTLLIIGSTFPYVEFYPKPGKARGVQIDRDGQRLGLRFPIECGLLGDARATLRTLIPLLTRKDERGFLTKIQAEVKDWNALLAERGKPDERPMRGDVAVEALSPLLAGRAIVTTDCGVNTAYAARHLKMRSGMMFSTSGTLASMGAGLPYAIAAKIAHPDRQVVSVVGDGGLTMLIGEMATAKKYGAAVKVVVLKNNSLGQIKWEQMAFLGNPEYVCDLQPIDFAAVARGFGWTAFSVSDPAAVAGVLAQGLEAEGPALVEVEIDQNDPLLPPKVKAKQAINLMKALMKGTPGRADIAAHIVQDAREMI
ncbi:thiamine pyrophosphate-dependent enzyme [Phenylobacterium sp.]|jgi:pyruvate dehydrogenase (quinone)/pyruvate oxidase|uniref:thiamine pyrophosphate-dependent enzyme n=1 Tax=Phenylobacterium sp. TaxID=1871053 RepID=UPI002E2FA29D|nr:thiamine pyrophosphate-dependent enzyme [Phenylobacterium sp.]HEX3364981.1 thiamine pyrophosphate-dependent enzyme [Phenylobacterium sp.]